MKNEILVKDEGFSSVKLAIGFENSSGWLEYNEYTLVDGGVLEMPAPSGNSGQIGAILADTVGLTKYSDYEVVEVVEGINVLKTLVQEWQDDIIADGEFIDLVLKEPRFELNYPILDDVITNYVEGMTDEYCCELIVEILSKDFK